MSAIVIVLAAIFVARITDTPEEIGAEVSDISGGCDRAPPLVPLSATSRPMIVWAEKNYLLHGVAPPDPPEDVSRLFSRTWPDRGADQYFVLVVRDVSTTPAGRYSGGSPAFNTKATACLFAWPDQDLLGSTTIFATPPRSTKISEGERGELYRELGLILNKLGPPQ